MRVNALSAWTVIGTRSENRGSVPGAPANRIGAEPDKIITAIPLRPKMIGTT